MRERAFFEDIFAERGFMGSLHGKLDVFLKDLNREIFHVMPEEFLEIDTYFQPIVELPSFRVIGYEALSRSISGRSILELLSCAKAKGLLSEFDLYCRIRAIIKAWKLGLSPEELLFLNVHPGVLEHRGHTQGVILKLLELLDIPSNQIVLEITEFERPQDIEGYLRTVFYYINQGFQVSLDDFGTGCVGYRTFLEIEPHFVKLDSYFVRAFSEGDYLSQKLLYHMVELCREVVSKVIAEGIEEERMLKPLRDLEIRLFQGYYFGKPSSSLKGGGEASHERHSNHEFSDITSSLIFLP
uniref:EAL domain-containing protein n=1 Tax=Caldimicrobium thiodismutans TaxID=1653476 RepID=A0A832GNZ8_9BACT